MKLPARAEDAHASLAAAAYNTGDSATVLSMYDVNGIIEALEALRP